MECNTPGGWCCEAQLRTIQDRQFTGLGDRSPYAVEKPGGKKMAIAEPMATNTGFVELDLDLTEEQRAVKDAARDFFSEVWHPTSVALDRLENPEDVIAEDSVLWDAIGQTYKLGYHKMGMPEEFGGLGMDSVTRTLVSEEMGRASADLAICLGAGGMPFSLAMLSPDPQVQDLARQYCDDTEGKMIGCWAITEPDHGSDWIMYGEKETESPKCAAQVRARLEGDEYVISGQKAAWVSNGTIATHASLFVNLDVEHGMHGSGIAIIPLDLPGIRRGKPLDKLGQRALNQGEIYFNDVRIPKSYMLCFDPTMFQMMTDQILATANAGMGVLFVGLAQAALDEALQYAKTRVQGGKPIIEHQNIKLKLFDMFSRVEAARSLSRRVALYNDVTMPPALHYSIASKTFSTETAFHVASEAIQIFGGNGLSKEYHIEKIFRDARAAMIEDGVNETLAIGGASRL